jgi:excisionase family DNA binding protein
MAQALHGEAMSPAPAHGRPPPSDSGQLLTIGQAAEYLGTGQRFVRRLISERRIPYVKLGKHVRLERSALDGFINDGRVPRQ